MSDELVDDLDDWGRHARRLEVLVGAEVKIFQRFPQHTSFGDVDGNEL